MTKIITQIKEHWQDIAAFMSILLLTSISVYSKYHLGMLVGFIILFIFFSYERIKRIIIELNIKKIFGVEFGKRERAEIVENVKNELKSKGTPLDDYEIENIADIALNQIQGVAYKGRYYEEMVGYALKDLNARVQHSVSGAVGKNQYHLDFLIEIGSTRVVGIEVVYSNQRYINTNKLQSIRQSIEAASKADDFAGFALVTNAEVRDKDLSILNESSQSITLIDETVSPDGLRSRIGEFLNNVQ